MREIVAGVEKVLGSKMPIHFPAVPATFRDVPRVGSTSFKFWALANITDRDLRTDPRYPNMLTHKSLDEIKKMWPDYGTTFGFVRNPYDRLVSIFHFLGQDSKKRIHRRKNNQGSEEVVSYDVEEDLKLLINYNKGFRYWIKNAISRDSDLLRLSMFNNKDTETQCFFFNNVIPDIVVKLEYIDRDFVKIQDLLKCYAPMQHTNTSLHINYREYYDSETQAIAYRWLEEDLDIFGYTF